jgi:hypothetical protein
MTGLTPTAPDLKMHSVWMILTKEKPVMLSFFVRIRFSIRADVQMFKDRGFQDY